MDRLEATVLDSISAHVALLDEKGVILKTNRAWRRFAADNGGRPQNSFVGMNYLSVCDAAALAGDDNARAAADGIRAVMQGDITEFVHDYPCHSPTMRHWFYMRATRLIDAGPLHLIISHEEITALKEAHEKLQHSKAAIEEQKQSLEESNIALKVLLRQRNLDKQTLEQKMLNNLKDLVFPYLERLKTAPLRARDRILVETIEKHLDEIASPLLQRLVNMNILLTPQEMQVAALVKDGRSSKEIAALLNVAETTVHFHRKNVRDKLGLKKKTANLRSYLLSMQ
ncbi:MAG: LuxR family transcriptional regulator [Desulfatitalea sp. BRH_c12]|nr:MAG: LuxR family transcriptional regulator [Desulfatitalea sp. BRH_c12]